MAARNISLALRVTPEEYLRIKKKAGKARQSVTEFVVRQCLGESEPEYKPVVFVRKPREVK